MHNATPQFLFFCIVVYVKQKHRAASCISLREYATIVPALTARISWRITTRNDSGAFWADLERGEIPWFSKPAARPLNDISALSSASDSQFNNVSVSSSASDHSRPTTAKGMTMIWQTAQKRYKPARMHHNRSCHTVSVPSSASDQPRSMTGKRVITIW